MERFDTYMERCLYGPDGFYTTHGVAGRGRGDFITSPEVGPLFGAVVANALDAWWDAAGRPDPWVVYDVGCGPNNLLNAVRRARPPDERPWHLIGIDRAVPAATDTDRLPVDLSGRVVLANELLDNMAFRIIEHGEDGAWSELYIDEGQERWQPTDARLDISPNTRAPLLEQASTWCADIVERGPAHLCLFDYCAATTRQLADRGGWLRTYRKHQRGDDPLADPGRWDITTDIAVDQLPPGLSVSSQTEFLRMWGIDDLVEEGRTYWKANAARPDLRAIAMRSRVSEAEALTDPDGLGSWLALHWKREQ